MNEADDFNATTRQDIEHGRRLSNVIRLGRGIMERLDRRHRYMFLEYERQIALLQEIQLQHAQAGMYDDRSAKPERRCYYLVMPNKMPNKFV